MTTSALQPTPLPAQPADPLPAPEPEPAAATEPEQTPGTADVTRQVEPYVVADSGESIEQISERINRDQFINYGADLRLAGPAKTVADTLFDYERLLDELCQLPGVEFVHHDVLINEPCPSDRIRVGIRHDIDTDIVGAMVQAQLEQERGVVSNWCVLHTAPYYGQFRDGVFYRNSSLGRWYRRLQDLGHEVSLHTDPLWIYQDQRVDGAQAVQTELAWLRSLGIDVRGSTAHNNRLRYGAENYEIFRGYPDLLIDELKKLQELEGRSPVPIREGQATEVIHEGKWAPLRQLDPIELGLTYESNQLWRQRHSRFDIYSIYRSRAWWTRRHRRYIADHPEGRELFLLDAPRAMQQLRQVEPGTSVALNLHPCYHAQRDRPDRGPVRRLNRLATRHNPDLGWFTWDPAVTQCWSGPSDGTQHFQVIQHANDLGMLDASPAGEGLSILVLGADNVDGLVTPVVAQFHRRVADLVDRHIKTPVRIHKLAHPGMGMDRLWSWFERTQDRFKPDWILLGVSDRACDLNDPLWWSVATGLSWAHPAGDLLLAADSGEVTVRPASDGWRVRRRSPRPENPLAARPTAADRRWKRVGALYRHAINRLREVGIQPALFVEGLGEGYGIYHGEEAHPEVDRLAHRLGTLAADLDVPMIDPYSRIRALPADLPAHAPTDHRWTTTAHRVASEVLFDFLRDQSILKTSGSDEPVPTK